MAVTLIVEDGSNVPNANSYADVATLRAYADSRGLDLPDGDDELAQMCIVAMDYIEAMEYRMKGCRTYDDQSLSWPRKGVCINGSRFPDNAIPKSLINALCQLTVDATALDGNLTPTQTEYAIRQEVIGPMSTTYAVNTVNGSGAFVPQYTKFDQFMRPLLNAAGGSTYR